MKKCASCTKDLPDAALHCVFCGAKQPPAPATAGGMAKTQLGAYQASDMHEHLRQQGRAAPPAAPYSPPSRPNPPSAPQPYQPPPPPGYPHPASSPAPLAPAAGAQAPTMFGGGPPPQQPMGRPMGGPAPYQPPPQPMGGPMGHGPGPMGHGPGPMGHGPMGPGPMGPGMGRGGPMAQPIAPIPQYMGQQTAARAGRPIEPWKDSLRLMMFVWGGVLLAAFVVPLSTDPMSFNWDRIIDAPGAAAKLPPLIMAAAGLLAIVLAAIPMSPMPRGLIAALLGLAGILTPIILVFAERVPPARVLIMILCAVVALVVLVPGLLVRQEYRESMLPRILVTVGVVAVLVPALVPDGDRVQLVEAFKAVIDAPGKAKIPALVGILQIVLAVLCLLVWLPSPSSAAAKIFAWLLILWPAFVHLVAIVLSIDQFGDAIGNQPNAALLAWADSSSYAVLVGYGLASVLGKQLE